MRILQINAVHKQGSTGRNVYEMNERFSALGHVCVAAYSVGGASLDNGEYLIGDDKDHKLHALLSRVTGLQGYFSRSATSRLLGFMDSFAPDVVILNNLHANYIHLPMLLDHLAKKDITTVAVLHDCWFYTGKCCHYTKSGCYRWKESCGGCKSLKKDNASWLFDRTQRMLIDKRDGFSAIDKLGVVAVSDWLLGEVQSAPVFAKAKLKKRIYNWIDTELFRPRDTVSLRDRLGLADKKTALAVASKWHNDSNFQTLRDISRGLNDDERIVLVGNVAQDVTLPDNIIAVGATESLDELAEYYSMADVFVQPAIEHTFGKVSAEALCCGTPVVCFDSTANPEIVGEDCGYISPVGDVDDMINNIHDIFSSGKEKYSRACRDYAQANFSKNNIDEYLRFFEQLAR